MNIGNVKLENPYILAPMAGVTDLPFRLLCKEQGAGLLCMEMVSAKALQYNNKNTKALMTIHPDEHPVSLQFFGHEPEVISEQAKRYEHLPFQILDINMGCPVPKIVNNGEGSSLMKNPKLYGMIKGCTFIDVDVIFCLNRAMRQTPHRFYEAKAALEEYAEAYIDMMLNIDYESNNSFNDLHCLFGAVCCLCELQMALPGKIITSKPLRSVLDRRPFI
jgi:hypothetical protein